jgi:hypothetical protein
MEIKNKVIELNNITLKEIKEAFKEKLGLKFDHYNDLNTAKTARKIKMTGVFDLDYVYTGPDGGVNNHIQDLEKRKKIILFLENELGIKGIELNTSGVGSLPKLVFRIKNK